MYNTDKLYRSYALINNILLQLEGETDLGEFSIRSSIPTVDQIVGEENSSYLERQEKRTKWLEGMGSEDRDRIDSQTKSVSIEHVIEERVDKEIRKFRGPNAWSLRVTESDNPRRMPCYSKMEIVRNFIQLWLDGVRFENHMVDKNYVPYKNWRIYLNAILRGQYKQCRTYIQDFLAMAGEIVYRIDTLDPPDQQTPTPQVRKLGFGFGR